jgi:hypothetical protein
VFGRGFAVTRVPRVIGDVPTRALELQRGSGQETLYVSATALVLLQGGSRKLLDYLENASAAITLIFVEWHRLQSPGTEDYASIVANEL